MKTFDINKPPKNLVFTSDIKNNITKMKNFFGEKFILKNGEVKLPMVIKLMRKNLLRSYEYYIIKYDGTITEDNWYPLLLDFNEKLVKKNDGYIGQIHNTSEYSGSQMVETALKFLTILRVQNAFLSDGASIHCDKDNNNNNLSFFKLLEKGTTFYQRFGFDIVEDKPHMMMNTKKKSQIKSKQDEILQKLRKITVNEMIEFHENLLRLFIRVYTKNDFANLFELRNEWLETVPFLLIPVTQQQLVRLIQVMHEILIILNKKKYVYFVDLLKDLFVDECNNYGILEEEIMNSTILGYKYKSQIIYKKHIKLFKLLFDIKNLSYGIKLKTQATKKQTTNKLVKHPK